MNKIITIVKHQPSDLCMNCMSIKNMKDYLKVERSSVDDNYELIEEIKYFEDLNVDND